MAYGQGAAMALPVWAIYMKKVYADRSLGYSQDETFSIPPDFDMCGYGISIDSDSLDYNLGSDDEIFEIEDW